MDTGGSAFPVVGSDIIGRGEEAIVEVYSYGGMTLLDYFAGQALTGIIPKTPKRHALTNSEKLIEQVEDTVRGAYLYAAAMIAEKKRLDSQKG